MNEPAARVLPLWHHVHVMHSHGIHRRAAQFKQQKGSLRVEDLIWFSLGLTAPVIRRWTVNRNPSATVGMPRIFFICLYSKCLLLKRRQYQ
jgi:hypothetical protein